MRNNRSNNGTGRVFTNVSTAKAYARTLMKNYAETLIEDATDEEVAELLWTVNAADLQKFGTLTGIWISVSSARMTP